MTAGRKRTINKRPGDEGYQPAISIKLPAAINDVLESLGASELNLEGFKGELIIRIEVIEVQVNFTFDPKANLSEEATNFDGEEDEEN